MYELLKDNPASIPFRSSLVEPLVTEQSAGHVLLRIFTSFCLMWTWWPQKWATKGYDRPDFLRLNMNVSSGKPITSRGYGTIQLHEAEPHQKEQSLEHHVGLISKCVDVAWRFLSM